MVTAIDTATHGEGTIMNTLNALKVLDAIDKSSAMKSAPDFKDLPQDARSPTVEETPRGDHDGSNKNYNAQGSPEVAGNIHAWVSPNKSDEVPSSKESSPDVSSNQTASLPSSKASSPESFNLDITALSDDNKENVEHSFSNADSGTLPIAIVGKRLVEQGKAADVPPLGLAEVGSSTPMTQSLNFDATSQNFVKIVHEGKEVLVMLHKDVSITVCLCVRGGRRLYCLYNIADFFLVE